MVQLTYRGRSEWLEGKKLIICTDKNYSSVQFSSDFKV